MFIIIGLGNPGRQYEHTRHNAGFDTLDILSDKWGIPMNKARCKSALGEGQAHGHRIVLAKPQTYMNDSGMAAVELLNWYKAPISQMLVIYDDIDLPVGQVRVRGSGSAGTHNGMRSIIRLTGRQDFPRVRVGIGRPRYENEDLKDFVLGQYRTDERAAIFDAFLRAASAVDCFVCEGLESAMREGNIRPPAQEKNETDR